jgi:hypothetical protein
MLSNHANSTNSTQTMWLESRLNTVHDMQSAQVGKGRTGTLSFPLTHRMSGVSVPSSCSVESPGFTEGSTMSRTCDSSSNGSSREADSDAALRQLSQP